MGIRSGHLPCDITSSVFWTLGFLASFEVVWWRWALLEVMGGWAKAWPWLPNTPPSRTLALYWEQFEERHLYLGVAGEGFAIKRHKQKVLCKIIKDHVAVDRMVSSRREQGCSRLGTGQHSGLGQASPALGQGPKFCAEMHRMRPLQ